jgi:hypothetical protein
MSVPATEFAGSVSNAAGMAGVVGKCEQDKGREATGCFLSEVVA